LLRRFSPGNTVYFRCRLRGTLWVQRCCCTYVIFISTLSTHGCAAKYLSHKLLSRFGACALYIAAYSVAYMCIYLTMLRVDSSAPYGCGNAQHRATSRRGWVVVDRRAAPRARRASRQRVSLLRATRACFQRLQRRRAITAARASMLAQRAERLAPLLQNTAHLARTARSPLALLRERLPRCGTFVSRSVVLPFCGSSFGWC